MKKLLSLILVSLVLKGYSFERTVVAEKFTATWCYYCPGAQMGLRSLKNEVGEQLVVIAYHYRDPFSVPEVYPRVSYYGVTGLPTVWFDGVLRRVGGSHTHPVNYRPFFDQRIGVAAPIMINLTILAYNPNTGNGQVNVRIFSESNVPIEGYLRCVMIGCDTFYHWQNQESLFDVCLGMFPNGASGEFITIQPTETISRNYNFTIPYGWRMRRCAIVAFLQDDNSREIRNAKEVILPLVFIKEDNKQIIDNKTFNYLFSVDGRIIRNKRFKKGVYFIYEKGKIYKKVVIE